MIPNCSEASSAAKAAASSEILEEKNFQGALLFESLFGVDAPVEIEVGCGNGRFLQRAAPERPDHLFLGIERNLKYAGLARDRMVKYGIGNVRICRADATRFLASAIAPGTVHAVHIYFTDPWPKKRHAKRRLVQTPFLETLHRILRPGGLVHVKVDLFWYFEEIAGRFDASPHFRVIANGVEADRRKQDRETTAFERRALLKQGSVFYLSAQNLSE